MAAGKLPKPGKVLRGVEIGPCVDTNCGHGDCVLARRMAARECPYCQQRIGYERAFYRELIDGRDVMVHAHCLEDRIQIEERRRAKNP